MQAGLTRAIPMGFIGFMVGALFVILLRGLQGLDPLWAAGPGIIMCVVTTAAFFIWGMGAFDPRLSVHGEAEAEAHEELEEEASEPHSILLGSTWLVVTLVILVFAALLGLAALPGGLALIQTVEPGASPTLVGYALVPLPFGGPDIIVSTFVLLALFVLWAFISLGLLAAAIGYGFVYLHNGLVVSQAEASGTLALPSGEVAQKRPSRSAREVLVTFVSFIVAYIAIFLVAQLLIGMILKQPLPILSWFFDVAGQVMVLSLIVAALIVRAIFGQERFVLVGKFLVTFVILYFVFYYVAIGLILPQPNMPVMSLFLTNPQQLALISFVNALLFTLIILYPTLMLHTVGRVSRWLAKVLRSVPRFLQ